MGKKIFVPCLDVMMIAFFPISFFDSQDYSNHKKETKNNLPSSILHLHLECI